MSGETTLSVECGGCEERKVLASGMVAAAMPVPAQAEALERAGWSVETASDPARPEDPPVLVEALCPACSGREAAK